jgi:hypothetical protein
VGRPSEREKETGRETGRGYTFPMGRLILLIALTILVGGTTGEAADPRLVDGVSGAPIAWTDWVAKRGPVAVLVWASWAPTADETIERHAEFVQASSESGLQLVVLVVQETLEEGRAALGGRDVGWLHDRHGALLKRYRVIEVPSLLVVAAEGQALGKLEATPEAVVGWNGS